MKGLGRQKVVIARARDRKKTQDESSKDLTPIQDLTPILDMRLLSCFVFSRRSSLCAVNNKAFVTLVKDTEQFYKSAQPRYQQSPPLRSDVRGLEWYAFREIGQCQEMRCY
jgi:hypothetical protein